MAARAQDEPPHLNSLARAFAAGIHQVWMYMQDKTLVKSVYQKK